MGVLRPAKAACALICLLALQGCAAVALSLAGLIGGTGLDHTLDGIVYRTYAAPAAGTRLAAQQTLGRMGMTVTKSGRQDRSWVIEATAAKRTIEIALEPLSPRATRVRVVVDHTDLIFLKDRSTSDGILDQIAVDLSKFTPEQHRLATTQLLLDELGYDPGGLDGKMGRNTRSAILRFQRTNGIRQDGEATPELIAALHERKAAIDAAAQQAKKTEIAKQGEAPDASETP